MLVIIYHHLSTVKSIVALNTLQPKKNGRHFADEISKCIFLKENHCILIHISIKCILRGTINSKSSLVRLMAWRLTGDKPLHEPMMTQVTDAYPCHQNSMSSNFALGVYFRFEGGPSSWQSAWISSTLLRRGENHSTNCPLGVTFNASVIFTIIFLTNGFSPVRANPSLAYYQNDIREYTLLKLQKYKRIPSFKKECLKSRLMWRSFWWRARCVKGISIIQFSVECPLSTCPYPVTETFLY